jgi:TRAP-type C4-dicarboxylate transport system permease small subunit
MGQLSMRALFGRVKIIEGQVLPRLESAAVAAFAGTVLGILTLHVLARVLGQSFPWTEEAARLGTIWAVFLSIPIFVRSESLLSLRVGIDALPRRIRSVITILNGLVLITVMATLLQIAVPIVIRDWARESPGLQWPVGLFTLPVVLMAVLSLIHAVPLYIRRARAVISGRIPDSHDHVTHESAI